jgi:hypothetical protein
MRAQFYDFSGAIYKLPSRERLIKRLGDYDALAEFAILGLLEFEAKLIVQKDAYQYISEKAQEHNVKIRGKVALDNYHEVMYKSFMVNTYSLFEEFIENIRNDIRILIDKNFVFVTVNNISEYERLKCSLKNIEVIPPIPRWLDQLEVYYRTVRNHVAHNKADDEKCLNAYRKIDLETMYSEYDIFKNLAPNPPGEITMQDFYLYSATVKHIANIIALELQDKICLNGIGQTHPELIHEHKPGTDRRSLAIEVLMNYTNNYSNNDLDKIVEDIRSQW